MTRTYIITGAASGIGAATAAILREQGNTVIGVDLKGSDIDGDLSTAAGRQAAATAALAAANGEVDAVIASAGIAAQIPLTVSVNYFGTTEFVDLLVPALSRSAAPRVATVSSLATLHPNSPELVAALLTGDEAAALQVAGALDPAAGFFNYSSSKRALSRWVRRESITPRFAGAGIALNAVAPGTVITPMTAEMLASPEGKAIVDGAVPMPLNSHCTAETIARMLVWLTSVENTHMTGQTLYIDGGADAALRGDDIWSAIDAVVAPAVPAE